MKTMKVPTLYGGHERVTVRARFKREIDGRVFAFAVTDVLDGFGQNLTHVKSGLILRPLGVSAAYLPAYSKLKADAYKARGEMALDDLLARAGAHQVAAKLAAAEGRSA